MKEEIVNEIIRFLKVDVINSPDVVIGEDDLIVEQGLIDSLGIVRLISHLQEHFKIQNIERKDVVLDNFKSISRVAALVSRYVSN